MNGLLSTLSAKLILGLGLGLAASLAGNFLLVRHMWVEAGEAKGEAERKALADKVAGFETTAKVNEALGKVAREDHEALVADLTAIAASTRGHQARSKKVIAASPTPAGCGPAQVRIDSVNQTLGPQK